MQDSTYQNRGYDVDQTLARFQPIALSLFRFIAGLLLFQYGVAKLLKFPAGNPFEKVELFSMIGAAGVSNWCSAGCC